MGGPRCSWLPLSAWPLGSEILILLSRASTQRRLYRSKEHTNMHGPLRCGLFGLLSIAVLAGLPLACQSGGVGDPCTPEDEYNPQFSGFAMAEEYIESRSFQCETRICLVNHFQGRVSCPLGQAAATITDCGGPSGPNDALCDKAQGETCVEAA